MRAWNSSASGLRQEQAVMLSAVSNMLYRQCDGLALHVFDAVRETPQTIR